jgi:hypothetical protein
MAKKKKRGRGASPQSTTSDETEAVPVAAAPEPPGALRDRLDPFGSPRARMLANAFIGVFLAYQVAMPLRYYMSGRGLDERFSWRMFSSVRMLECEVDVAERVAGHERDVPLSKTVQVAWIGLLERGRSLVIEKFLSRRCDEEGVVRVDYHLTCKAPDGSKGPDVDRHMKCSDRKLVLGRGEP